MKLIHTHKEKKPPKSNETMSWIFEKKNQVTIEGDMIFHTERTKNVTKSIRTNK